MTEMTSMTLHDGESGNFLQRACVGKVPRFGVMPSCRHGERRTRRTKGENFKRQVEATLAAFMPGKEENMRSVKGGDTGGGFKGCHLASENRARVVADT
jgi:hypothetical protein